MEKTIIIDGKEVKFKANASFPLIYKAQFGTDILTIFMPLLSETLKGFDGIYERKETIKPSLIGELLENVYSLEMVDVLNMIWSMAKAADPGIEEPLKWFSQFNEFPVFDVGQELAEILIPSLVSKKKLESLKKIANLEK